MRVTSARRSLADRRSGWIGFGMSIDAVSSTVALALPLLMLLGFRLTARFSTRPKVDRPVRNAPRTSTCLPVSAPLMAKNIKKFVNPKFTRTVGLEPMRRLLERHRDALAGFDLSIFDGDPARGARRDPGLLRRTRGELPRGSRRRPAPDRRARRCGWAPAPAGCGRAVSASSSRPSGTRMAASTGQDPKHVALRVFLDLPVVFETASDMLAHGGALFPRRIRRGRGGDRGRAHRRDARPRSRPRRRRCSRPITAAATAGWAGTPTPTRSTW